jgi:nitrite reductase/ring-hydroxylating ferredoxin subunit
MIGPHQDAVGQLLVMCRHPRSLRKDVPCTGATERLDVKFERRGETDTVEPLSQERRSVLKAALALGLSLSFSKVAAAPADDPRMARPRKGDRFVFAFGERRGEIIRPEDLPLGGPQQETYPMDPRTKIVRDGSLYNDVLLIRLEPAQLSEDTHPYAAGGVVAYSAVCTHQGCPVSMWKEETRTLFCACHASQFDPRDRARIVDGPAPRRLPILPLETRDGFLVAAGGFVGRVGTDVR